MRNVCAAAAVVRSPRPVHAVCTCTPPSLLPGLSTPCPMSPVCRDNTSAIKSIWEHRVRECTEPRTASPPNPTPHPTSFLTSADAPEEGGWECTEKLPAAQPSQQERVCLAESPRCCAGSVFVSVWGRRGQSEGGRCHRMQPAQGDR